MLPSTGSWTVRVLLYVALHGLLDCESPVVCCSLWILACNCLPILRSSVIAFAIANRSTCMFVIVLDFSFCCECETLLFARCFQRLVDKFAMPDASLSDIRTIAICLIGYAGFFPVR